MWLPNERYYDDDIPNFTNVPKDMFNLWKIEELRQKQGVYDDPR